MIRLLICLIFIFSAGAGFSQNKSNKNKEIIKVPNSSLSLIVYTEPVNELTTKYKFQATSTATLDTIVKCECTRKTFGKPAHFASANGRYYVIECCTGEKEGTIYVIDLKDRNKLYSFPGYFALGDMHLNAYHDTKNDFVFYYSPNNTPGLYPNIGVINLNNFSYKVGVYINIQEDVDLPIYEFNSSSRRLMVFYFDVQMDKIVTRSMSY